MAHEKYFCASVKQHVNILMSVTSIDHLPSFVTLFFALIFHPFLPLVFRQPLCERGRRAAGAGNLAAPQEGVWRPPDAAQEQPPGL